MLDDPRKHHNARGQVGKALAKGTLIRPVDCPLCGDDNVMVEAHHENYDKPLDVTWACRPCHMWLHVRSTISPAKSHE
jgi:ribosomal protein S27AE